MKKSRNWRQKLADKLFQQVVKKLNPRSLISFEPTEVAHHFVPKSVSNRLRYDLENGIPLTNKEHCRLHQSGDPEIEARIIQRKGTTWLEYILKTKHELVKTDVAHYDQNITFLREKLDNKPLVNVE